MIRSTPKTAGTLQNYHQYHSPAQNSEKIFFKKICIYPDNKPEVHLMSKSVKTITNSSSRVYALDQLWHRIHWSQMITWPIKHQHANIKEANSGINRAYSSSLLHAIIACNHLPLFKIFSNFVHFHPNFQILPKFCLDLFLWA